jgi:hypothetical protein
MNSSETGLIVWYSLYKTLPGCNHMQPDHVGTTQLLSVTEQNVDVAKREVQYKTYKFYNVASFFYVMILDVTGH